MKRLLVAIGCVLSLSFAAYADEPTKAPAAPDAKPAVAAPAVAPAAASAAVPAAATPAKAAKDYSKMKANPKVTIPIFLLIIGATMAVVVWSAKQTKSASDFYTAGGGITGTQNGWAIAGDYMSAASFLGISGLISLYGYDGFMYSVGWLVAYITVLLI
ncbi:MAG: cation acetate symporter, partial [Geobacteraceae bacterium]|nr:cation acetate symporter [Geobacteraceae bacterium]